MTRIPPGSVEVPRIQFKVCQQCHRPVRLCVCNDPDGPEPEAEAPDDECLG